MLAFLNSSEYENNIYLDDINVYKVVINPNLKAKGCTGNAQSNQRRIECSVLPQVLPLLKGIAIYNASGQKVVRKARGK